jgi:glycosyltransferase involved in cell wall biosynthesis
VKIAFDSYILSACFRSHGSYIYARNLLAHMPAMASLNGDSILVFSPPHRIENDVHLLRATTGLQFSDAPGMLHRRVWRFGGVGRAAARSGADVLFCPVPAVPLVRSVRSFVTIHDATEMTSPSHSFARRTIEQSVITAAARLADRILTISDCSKRDLVRYYGISADRIDVVYNGYSANLFHCATLDTEALAAELALHGVKRPYLLHFGTLQPRKNLVRLIRAYRLLMERRPDLDFDLVLTGAYGWCYGGILAEAARSGGRGSVIITGPVEERILPILIKGAALTVIPSLYEGFCLPMVESMACGTPTIVSNTSCLPEISGGVLRYFDPLSIDEIAATIETVLDSDSIRTELRYRGIERARLFSWERCARETLCTLVGPHYLPAVAAADQA